MRAPILILLSLIVLTSCGRGESARPSRAERMKPRINVSNDAVTLRQPPGANAFIDPQGVLKVDDIQLPQSPENTLLLRTFFGRMQMLRLQTLGPEANSSQAGSLKAEPDAETRELQHQLLKHVPPLKPYEASFDNIQVEHR